MPRDCRKFEQRLRSCDESARNLCTVSPRGAGEHENSQIRVGGIDRSAVLRRRDRPGLRRRLSRADPERGASCQRRAQGPGDLGALIAAGTLPDLRWPNFTDYRDDVKKFYGSGGNSLAWIQNGKASPQAVSMILLFQQAASKGLNPDDYDASRWDARLAKLQPSAPEASDTDLAHIDLALTVCAMRYISDLHVGRVNPQHFKFGLVVGPKRLDLAELLRTQVLPASDIPAVIAKVEPPYDGYRRAEDALLTYLKMASAGDAPLIPVPQKGVRPGNSFASMPQLVARLRQLGDLPSNADVPANSTVYDGAVVAAVKHFQRRHGLDIDGVLGKGTVTQLNVPLKTRVQQLQLTLERYRWIPPDFPEPPIVVNIPEFRLHTMRRQPANYLTMKVVVGRAMRTQTPVFANSMKYVIFRPYWLVPLVDPARRAGPKDAARSRLSGRSWIRSSRWKWQRCAFIAGVGRGHKRTSFRRTECSTNTRTQECARPGQVHIPQSIQRVPAQHAGAGTVLAFPPRLQSRMHPGREIRSLWRRGCCATSPSGRWTKFAPR